MITGKPRPRPKGKEVWSPGFSSFLGGSPSDPLWKAILGGWLVGQSPFTLISVEQCWKS